MTYLSILTLLLLSLFTSSYATRFTIKNNCPQTVWAAASPGGGRRLDSGQTWDLDVPSDTSRGRIWGRTKCNFDCSCMGPCETGDCGSTLECKGPWGVRWGDPPNTLAEYSLGRIGNFDFYDISLVNGFNIPIEFSPTGGLTTSWCKPLFCTANIVGECPGQLRVPGGCNNPCTTFKTQEYCCTNGPCGPTDYSQFFKKRCPNAYSYPQDDPNTMLNCPAGTNFRVTFCPMGNPRFPALYNYGNKNETFVNVE